MWRAEGGLFTQTVSHIGGRQMFSSCSYLVGSELFGNVLCGHIVSVRRFKVSLLNVQVDV